MNKKESAKDLLKKIEDKLKGDFERIKKQYYNTGEKGRCYENILKNFLEEYMEGVLDFYTRSFIIDRYCDCFDIFKKVENEFDVVATFSTSIPKLIFSIENLKYIPYDSIAFICEVKQTLTKSFLEKDLKKFRKLSNLKFKRDFPASAKYSKVVVDRPLRCLVYEEKEIGKKTFEKIISMYEEYCDMILIIENNLLWINKNLPITQALILEERLKNKHQLLNDGILLFLLYLSVSISYPMIASTIRTFNGLRSWRYS